jgi:predicted dehydrogenase
VQSTPSDRGPLLIETRVIGSTGTAWIEGLGSTVSVADAAGTCTIAVPDDLVVRPPAPPPSAALRTTYEQMTGHGLDLGPYTRLAEHFRAAIAGEPPPPGPPAATFADGVADMGVLDAARNSSTARQSVDVV